MSGMASGKNLDQFNRRTFEEKVLAKLETFELKQRAQWIADQIHEILPINPEPRKVVLRSLLHPEVGSSPDQTSDAKGIRGWGIYPLTLVVAQHDRDNFEDSMELLREMTKRFTSEFGIRYFLLEDQSRALNVVNRWIEDPSPHVRRLVSEGTRPRLPWAMQLPELMKDPSPMIPLLEKLKDDESEYVRRSVANHLNDIARDHPEMIAKLALRWMENADSNRERLLRHGCRSLIKQGHPLALRAFGIMAPNVELTKFEIDPIVLPFGSDLRLHAEIRSLGGRPQQLIVDYCLHLKKANGRLSAKVFKGSRFEPGAQESIIFTKRHCIKPITTRRYYPGIQGVSLRINGQDFGYCEFELTMDD